MADVFTKVELDEIKGLNDMIHGLDNKILCSDMADGQAWFDEEPLREKWSKERSEAYARINTIADGRDWIKAIYGSE